MCRPPCPQRRTRRPRRVDLPATHAAVRKWKRERRSAQIDRACPAFSEIGLLTGAHRSYSIPCQGATYFLTKWERRCSLSGAADMRVHSGCRQHHPPSGQSRQPRARSIRGHRGALCLVVEWLVMPEAFSTQLPPACLIRLPTSYSTHRDFVACAAFRTQRDCRQSDGPAHPPRSGL